MKDQKTADKIVQKVIVAYFNCKMCLVSPFTNNKQMYSAQLSIEKACMNTIFKASVLELLIKFTQMHIGQKINSTLL